MKTKEEIEHLVGVIIFYGFVILAFIFGVIVGYFMVGG
jgi:hypothetical protein